ncbi:MAG: non-ribosomal peptide synthetase [Candidatus Binatota bacterium]|nr:non-ribosomal peptide synthetase [Candidatus Binatota bacterium]
MTQQDSIPRIIVQPASGFIEFGDDEIEQSIPQRFEQQVQADGNRVAIKSDRDVYTFDSLNRTANRLARQILTRRGSSMAEPIALLFDHGAAVLVAIMAVLKAGKFYIALDASYPRDRLKYMLQDSGAKLIVTDPNNIAVVREICDDTLDVVDFMSPDVTLPDDNLGMSPKPDSLALLLYTSGSTGQPKGAMHTHRNVLVDVRNLTNGWGVSAKDRWLLHTSVSFANSVRTIFSSLLNGGSIYPYDIKETGFGALPDWLAAQEITIFRTVPTTFRDFMGTLERDQKFPSVRLLSVGGEPMLRDDLDYFNRHFLGHCVLCHALGPTECLTVCWALIPHGSRITETKLPIGYPLKDKDVLVLDDNRRELGDGKVGELAVKSRYISLGYWRDPERTHSVFLPDPAGTAARIYLTGDLGLRRPDGCLVHVGREDFQVKIRGFRIDVTEIEIALRAIDVVADAVVVGRQDEPSAQRLIAYFVPATHPPVTITKLRQILARTLPDYMIPSSFVSMAALPQTPNGKTDRLRLPPPARNRPDLDNPFVPPGTATETELSTIWSDVLGIDQLGINDNFFELGGDSLLATRIVTLVLKKFRADLPIRTLFDTPTIARQAEQLLLWQTKAISAQSLANILNEIESLSDEEIYHRLTSEKD